MYSTVFTSVFLPVFFMALVSEPEEADVPSEDRALASSLALLLMPPCIMDTRRFATMPSNSAMTDRATAAHCVIRPTLRGGVLLWVCGGVGGVRV